MQRLSGHAVPVTMANTVNLINANGLLAVRRGGLVKSATYHVWDLYQNRTDEVAEGLWFVVGRSQTESPRADTEETPRSAIDVLEAMSRLPGRTDS